MMAEAAKLLLANIEHPDTSPRSVRLPSPLILRTSARIPRRVAPLRGFDPKYADLPDFILRVTREIWETRRVHTLRGHYAPDIKVRSPASLVIGNESVIAATLATQAEFPDRELLGEDVIWSGSPEEGMLSSHRILSVATHSHDGSYGRATGRQVSYRVIADCHARNNRIDDEWIIRDQGAIVRQLGWDPVDYTRHAIESEGGPEACARDPSCPKPMCPVPIREAATTTSGARSTPISSGASWSATWR